MYYTTKYLLLLYMCMCVWRERERESNISFYQNRFYFHLAIIILLSSYMMVSFQRKSLRFKDYDDLELLVKTILSPHLECSP